MKTASVRDLRNHFARVSRWIKDGQEVEITSRGVTLARLVPVAQPKLKAKRKRGLFDLEEHRKWMKKVYGGKALPGNSVLIMREGSEW
jgi:prevent-host-death family protein